MKNITLGQRIAQGLGLTAMISTVVTGAALLYVVGTTPGGNLSFSSLSPPKTRAEEVIRGEEAKQFNDNYRRAMPLLFTSLFCCLTTIVSGVYVGARQERYGPDQTNALS